MRDITPQALRCGPFNCPAIHELPDGRLLIVGKRADQQAHDAGIGMSPDEQAVIIDRALVAGIK